MTYDPYWNQNYQPMVDHKFMSSPEDFNSVIYPSYTRSTIEDNVFLPRGATELYNPVAVHRGSLWVPMTDVLYYRTAASLHGEINAIRSYVDDYHYHKDSNPDHALTQLHRAETLVESADTWVASPYPGLLEHEYKTYNAHEFAHGNPSISTSTLDTVAARWGLPSLTERGKWLLEHDGASIVCAYIRTAVTHIWKAYDKDHVLVYSNDPSDKVRNDNA